MDVVQQFDTETYDDEDGRVYPIDDYEIPEELLQRCRRYRFLKVPLMGQYFVPNPGANKAERTQDWCGRTSCSILYNYFELAKGGDPRGRYITHWDAGQHPFLDLRMPEGERAFHDHPTKAPFDRKMSGVRVGEAIPELWPHYSEGKLLPFEASTTRLSEAAAIAASEPRIRQRFAPLIAALNANNPALMYTGFSKQQDTPGHLILAVGYAYITQGGRDHLWIAIADPSTPTSKIVGSSNRKKVKFFRTPGKATGSGDDIGALSELSDEDNLIRVHNGDWYKRQGSLILIRARAFFEENVDNSARFDLLMDDFLNSSRKGGTFLHSITPTPVPDALVVSSEKSQVGLPFDLPRAPRSPIAYLYDNETSDGGFYPLGLFRNIHGGVHIPPPTPQRRAVRAAAAGQIVAVRLEGAVPPDVAAGQGDPARASRSEELSGTSNAMVLVRHTAELRPAPTEAVDEGGAPAEAETVTFYTLYMHLLVPDFEDPAGEHARVPWLNALLRRQAGSLTIIDPKYAELGPTLWPREAPADPLVEQGTFEVYGKKFTDTEQADLGSSPGRVRAVAKPPDEDALETLQALTDGKVVTFAPDYPDMMVARGQLLGFVPETSAMGPGFLHFEVLSPAGTGVTRLAEFADERLELDGLFGAFEEDSDNNFFDAGGGEMDNLLELLPDGGAGLAIDNSYGAAELRTLLRQADPLPFATDTTPSADDPLVYASTLRLHAFADALPAGDYPVQLIFRGGERELSTEVVSTITPGKPSDVEVMVPAWADSVEVMSEDFDTRSGGPRPTQQQEVEHFSRVAAARWRNVKVTHLNEWSADGLKTSLQARFEGAATDIDPLIDAMAWWDYDEEPVVGAEGSEPSLFADGGEPHQLPKTCEVEHLHPIIFTWMLDLLVRHRHLTIVEPRAPAPTTVDPTDVEWLGWLPARAEHPVLSVGDSVQALAVSVASPAVRSHGEVTIGAAVADGPTVVLGSGAWDRDLMRVAAPASFWGRAELSIEGQSPRALGGAVLEVGTPVLDTATPLPPPRAQKLKGHLPRAWSIPFSAHCPRSLVGWVVFKAATTAAGEPVPEAAAFEEVHVGIPVEANRRGANPPSGSFKVESGFFIEPANVDVHVSKNFTWSEYFPVDAPQPAALPKAKGALKVTGVSRAATTPKVAEALVLGVQAVRSAYGYEVSVSSLAADGLSVYIKGANLARVLALSKKQSGFSDVSQAEDDLPIRVEVPAPDTADGLVGVLDFEFDPGLAYQALLEELAPPPGQHVHVIAGVRFFNGGPLIDPAVGDVETYGQEAKTAVDWEALSSAAGGSVIEAFSHEPLAVLSRPAFGSPTWSISGRSLVVSVPLIGGDLAMWKACAPRLSVGNAKVGAIVANASATDTEARYMLTTSLDMGRSAYKAKALSIVATVTKTGVMHGGAEVAVSDSEALEYDTTPRVESVQLSELPAQTPDRLEVEAQTYGIPAGNSLELYFEADDIAKDEWAPLAVQYPIPDVWSSGTITGKCDDKGVFRASVALEALGAILRPEQSPRAFVAHVGRRWGPVLGKTLESVTADGQLAPPPPEEGEPDDPGPVEGGMNIPTEGD